MRKTRGISALTALSIIAASCVGNAGKSAAGTVELRQFPMPVVPGVITDPALQAEYVALHWWDAMTDTSSLQFCDSTTVNGVALGDVEQAFSNYTHILRSVIPIEKARDAVARLYDRAWAMESADTSSNVFEQVSRLAESYFYDPNSPLRCEDLFQPFAARLAANDRFSELERERYARVARNCLLNAIGTAAADFAFSDKKGSMHRLYELKADFTVLFFSNPGCKACKEIIDALNSSQIIAGMLQARKLAVANIYIDENPDEWYKYMSNYPESWYNGYDPNLVIRTDNLYDIRAIPSLYLLDKDKKVIMKDAVTDDVLGYLENQQ